MPPPAPQRPDDTPDATTATHVRRVDAGGSADAPPAPVAAPEDPGYERTQILPRPYEADYARTMHVPRPSAAPAPAEGDYARTVQVPRAPAASYAAVRPASPRATPTVPNSSAHRAEPRPSRQPTALPPRRSAPRRLAWLLALTVTAGLAAAAHHQGWLASNAPGPQATDPIPAVAAVAPAVKAPEASPVASVTAGTSPWDPREGCHGDADAQRACIQPKCAIEDFRAHPVCVALSTAP